MGQGEPLLNFELVMAAVRIMLDPEGMSISPKHMTPFDERDRAGESSGWRQEKVRPKLAISLNASNDEQRDALIAGQQEIPAFRADEGLQGISPAKRGEHLDV